MTFRILVVDDEPAVRRTLERALQHFGYEVVAVADACAAYEALGGLEVHAILLDVRMPELLGDALYVAIARRWPAMVGRVVMMTGAAWDVHDCPADLAGVPVLSKPFSLEQLQHEIARVLREAARTDEAARQQRRNG